MYTVYAQFQDIYGNESNIVSDSVIFEYIAPLPVSPHVTRTNLIFDTSEKQTMFLTYIQNPNNEYIDNQIIEEVIKKMKPVHTEHLAIFPQPEERVDTASIIRGISGYSNKYDIAVEDFVKKYNEQEGNKIVIYPFLCGFDPTNPASLQYIEGKLQQGLFKGIGEIFLYEIEVRWVKTTMQQESLNHPVVLSICDIAAKYNVPLVIHCDSQKSLIEYSAEDSLEYLLSQKSNTIIVWAHAGLNKFSNAYHYDVVSTLLSKYPNLYCDISPMDYSQQVSTLSRTYLDIYFSDNWINLYQTFSDRFLFGTNYNSLFGKYSGNIISAYTILEQLHRNIFDQGLLDKLQYQNAGNILHDVKNITDFHFHYRENLDLSILPPDINTICLFSLPGDKLY